MRLIILLLVSLLVTPVQAKVPPIVLSTMQSAVVGRAPLTVRFRAAIQPDEHNRQLCFEWASDASSGQSCLSMEGEASPITYWKDVTFRTGGEFYVIAEIERNDTHTLTSNVVTIHVLGIGE